MNSTRTISIFTPIRRALNFKSVKPAGILNFSLCHCLIILLGFFCSIYPAHAEISNSIVYIRLFAQNASEPIGEGSGFLVSQDGYIVTARHVVQSAIELGAKITVSLKYKSNNQVTASIFRCDPKDKNPDICLIRINSDAVKGEAVTSSSKFGCRSLKIGEEIIAYGYAFGEKNTLFVVPGKTIGGLGELDLYPSNIPMTYGMSGGPIVDIRGNIIGVVAGGVKGGTHGYFTPISQVATKLLDANIQCTLEPLEDDRSQEGLLLLDKIQSAEIQLVGVDDIMSVKINNVLAQRAEFGEVTPWHNIKPLLKKGANGILVEIWNGAYGSCGGALQVRINGKILPDVSKRWFMDGSMAPYKGNCTTELLTLNLD